MSPNLETTSEVPPLRFALRVAEPPVAYGADGEPRNIIWVDFNEATDEEIAVLRDVYRRNGGRKVILDGEVVDA